MRIGFFTEGYFPEIDGVVYTLKSWKERLEERGHEVYIIYPDSADYEPGEREIPVKSIPNPFYSGYNIPMVLSFDNLPELDIVHCHGPFTIGRAARRYGAEKGIPTVYTHHTPVEDYFEQNTHSKKLADIIEKLYLPLENRFLRKFDRVTASTPEINRDVDIVELPVGLDTEFFQPTETDFLDEYDRPVIGYSGRISIEKNLDQVMEVAEDIDATFVIVGEGPQKPKITRKAPDNVVFMDFLPRDKLPEFYSAIDLFVTASTGDTLGLSPLEANACGTPVVAPDVPPFNTTLNGGNGAKYAFGDMEEFKQKIDCCLNNRFDTRPEVEKYSLNKTIENLEEIYRELVDESGWKRTTSIYSKG